jgi:hypothetical protein
VNILRILNRLPSPVSVDNALTQLWAYRALCGGIYVKMQGRWHGAYVLLVLGDGTRILRRDDYGGGSFHETFNGIQALEEHA